MFHDTHYLNYRAGNMWKVPFLLTLFFLCITFMVKAQLTLTIDTLHVGGINDLVWDWEKNYNLGTNYISASGIATDISITNHSPATCILNLSNCRFGYIYFWNEKYNIEEENVVYSKDSVLMIPPDDSVKLRFPSSSISLHTFIHVPSMDWFAQIVPSVRFYICTPDGNILFSGPYQVLDAQQYLTEPRHFTWNQYFSEKRALRKQLRKQGLSSRYVRKENIVMKKTLKHPFQMEDFYERLSKCAATYVEQSYPTIPLEKLHKPIIEDSIIIENGRKF